MNRNMRDIFKSVKLLLLVFIIFSDTVQAAQVFQYKANEKIKGVISSKNLNRIQFGDHQIIQVIGDEVQYKIVQDVRGINLFINPQVVVGEEIELALLDSAGRVADLVLKVSDIGGQIILISESEKNKKIIESDKKELRRLLRHMIYNRQDKYFVESIKRDIEGFQKEGIKVQQDLSYRYGKYVGARLRVTNISKLISKRGTEIELKEDLFARLFNAEYMEISQACSKLKPGKSCYIWIALKERKDD
jgi:hypothetical protein